MLYDLIAGGFGKAEDYNCAEKILYGANIAYGLGLDKQALTLAAGFGGGMGIESVCGVLTASIMVLSRLHVKSVAHQSEIKRLEVDLFDRFRDQFRSIDCKPLKADFRTEEKGCYDIIASAAKLLDEIVIENKLLA